MIEARHSTGTGGTATPQVLTQVYTLGNDVETSWTKDTSTNASPGVGTASHLVNDLHGSVRSLTAARDINAGWQETKDYDAFGVLTLDRNAAGTSVTPALSSTHLGYAGEWKDEILDAQFLRSRWMRPDVGGFLSRDTAEFGPGEVGDANLYAYVGGDAANEVDPSGHEASVAEVNANAATSANLSGLRLAGLAAVQATSSQSLVFIAAYSRLATLAAGISLTAGGALTLGLYWQRQLIQLQQQKKAMTKAHQQAILKVVSDGTVTKNQADSLPVFYVYRQGPFSTPSIWKNDSDAVSGRRGLPAPILVNYTGPNKRVRNFRRAGAYALAAKQGLKSSAGNNSLDEYPYASVAEGGASPWLHVDYVPEQEQSQQGSDLSAFYGTFQYKAFRFLVVLVP